MNDREAISLEMYNAFARVARKLGRCRAELTTARAVLKDLAVFSMSAQSDPNRLAEQYRGDLAAVCNRAMAAMDAMEVRIAQHDAEERPEGTTP